MSESSGSHRKAKHAIAACVVLFSSCEPEHQVAKKWRYDVDATCDAICEKAVDCGEQPNGLCETLDCDECHENCVNDFRQLADPNNEFCLALFEATIECLRESTCTTYYQASGGPASCDRMRRASRACFDDEGLANYGNVGYGVSTVTVTTVTSSGDTMTSGTFGVVATSGSLATSTVGGVGGAWSEGETGVPGGAGGADDMPGGNDDLDPLLIDDFEDGDDPHYTGSWHVALDAAATGAVNMSDPANPTPEPLEPPRTGSWYGMHLAGHWGGSGAALGFEFRTDGGSIDTASFSGFSFWAKASAGSVRVVAVNAGDGGRTVYQLEPGVTDSWSEVVILWKDLPAESLELSEIRFELGNGPFDVWIDDVRFVE